MKQFRKILGFELRNYFQNKVFVGVTVFLVLTTAAVMFFPRIAALFSDGETELPADDRPVMLLSAENEAAAEMLETAFAAAFPDYEVLLTKETPEQIRHLIVTGEAMCAFVLHESFSYTYYVDNLSIYDQNTGIADSVLESLYRMTALTGAGIAPEAAEEILTFHPEHTIERLGKDQAENYWYTYIMIFALYMVILLYGQMVATNVAVEKSSRAMEVLITSADPVSMMFGKVLASCLAGLIQLTAVFGSSILFYRLNEASWGENPIISSIFDMPPDLLVYLLIYFVLGFLIYAFLFGAVGSTASKLEDINTSVMPITMMFIFAFFVVIFSFGSGDVDNLLMRICSYVPFTSSMAMFTRIAMSTVPWYEILLSVLILAGSVFGVGVVSAKIYRVGVLMYGTTPKLRDIIRAVRNA